MVNIKKGDLGRVDGVVVDDQHVLQLISVSRKEIIITIINFFKVGVKVIAKLLLIEAY